MLDHGGTSSAPYRLCARGMLLVVALFQWSCEKTVVSVVEVSEVEVDPAELTLVEGAREKLSVLVKEEGGAELSRADVTWTVDNDEVAEVDDQGEVVALAPGSTQVHATSGGVTGTAAVTVMPGPAVGLSRSTVELESSAGDEDPITTEVDVENAGGGILEDLAVHVEGSNTASADWLVVELLGTAAPTRLRLEANPDGLEEGSYEASVTVESSSAPDEPAKLTVRLVVQEATTPGTTCDIRNRIFFGDLRIPGETSCTIVNVRVLGDLELARGARLTASELRVDGNVEGKDADELVLLDSRVLGDLKFEDGGRATIRGTDVGDDIVLKNNRGDLDVRDNEVGDDFTVDDNLGGPFTLLRNAINGKLECKGNQPAPTGGGNITGDKKQGQCRTL